MVYSDTARDPPKPVGSGLIKHHTSNLFVKTQVLQDLVWYHSNTMDVLAMLPMLLLLLLLMWTLLSVVL